MPSTDVGLLCFMKFEFSASIYQVFVAYFMLPPAKKLYGDANFTFQQDLTSAQTVKY